MKKLLILLSIVLFIGFVSSWTTNDCIGYGGVVTIDGDYCVNTFNSSSSFTWIGGSSNASILVVAGGGGGGGSTDAGGGGAGGLLYNATYFISSQTYPITVGLGGEGGATNTAGANGFNSIFGTLTAVAGGGGATYAGTVKGKDGGSGGGGANANQFGFGTGGQGKNGGNYANSAPGYGGGGGGGAGASGGNATGTAGGAGGVGLEYSINGTSVMFACGGGGALMTGGSAGAGGCSTAGAGSTADGNNATNGYGGGGGGAERGATGKGGNGGSGIVIIRYQAQESPLRYNAPVDYYNSTTSYVLINATINLTNLVNVTLYTDGILNQTNTSGVIGDYLFNKTFSPEKHNFSITACSNTLCLNLSNMNLNILFWENSQTFNISTSETKTESYSVNVSGSVSAVKLLFNGTPIVMSNSGSGIWSLTRDVPTTTVGNNTIAFRYTYLGIDYDSSTSYQYVNPITFVLCNATYTSKFLNLTFKDEENGTRMNASIPTSTFIYYLGSGVTNKSYTYSTSSELSEYDFCFSNSSLSVNVASSISYTKSGYPQRNSAETLSLSSVLRNLTYYLLDSSSGIYVTFQVLNGANQPISGVSTTVNRTIGSTSTTISTGTTGTDGGVTFWLNPDFSHSLLFSKTGYSDYLFSLTPTQTLYTVTLSGNAVNATPDYSSGISISFQPYTDFLTKNLEYNLNYTISSNVWNLDEYGYTLSYSNGTEIDTNTGSTNSGGTLNTLVNVSNVSRIMMNYYYIVNSTQINGTRYWIISGTGDYSIKNLFNNINTAITGNIYGINGSSNDASFAKALICIVILLGTTFTLSKRYGIQSEPAVMGIVFGVVLLLNSQNLIPNPSFFTNSIISFGNLVVFITFIIMASFVIREER